MNKNKSVIKNLLSYTVIIIVLLMASCEGGTTFTKTIENKSSETIIIKLYTVYGSNDPITINSYESKEIYWDDQMGRFVDDSYNCMDVIDTVEITITNNKKLLKDIMDSANWLNESKGGRNSREDCTFIITD
ncbi:MAG: hypothetical protein C0598_13235, partial [Marinilabiliales bacterium]